MSGGIEFAWGGLPVPSVIKNAPLSLFYSMGSQ